MWLKTRFLKALKISASHGGDSGSNGGSDGGKRCMTTDSFGIFSPQIEHFVQ
jgi:hypothetical protein